MKKIKPKLSKTDKNIAIVVSEYNDDITCKLLDSALRALENYVDEEKILISYVPGVVEIPLVAKKLAKSGKYEAVIVFGAVIYGETDHYYYVCDMVTSGCREVMLETSIPVIFGVLTVKDKNHAIARVNGSNCDTGKECAEALLKMLDLNESLKEMI